MEVPEEPRLPRHAVRRQQPRRAAIQERTQECMTAVMTEGIAPCGGPGGTSIAKGSRRKAANLEGSQTAVMTEGIAPCGGPGGASIPKGSRRKAATPEGCDSRADSRMHD